MKLLRNLAVGLVVLVIAAVVVGFFLPRTVSVERSIVVNAPQPMVFSVINSLRAFSRWSPWSDADPDMTLSFAGPDSGVGQKMTWSSEKDEVGSGSMEIKDSLVNEKVVMTIVFNGEGQAGTSLSLASVEDGTKVAWSFAYDLGVNPFARYMGLVMPGIVGDEYAKGLNKLKAYIEAIPKVDISNLAVSRVTVPPQTLIAMRVTGENTPAGMSAALASGYATIQQALKQLGIAADGAPISIARGVEGGKVVLDAAIPIKQAPDKPLLPPGVRIAQIEEGEALRVTHQGSYDTLVDTNIKLLAYALTSGWKIRGPIWNEYVSGPETVSEDDIQMNVYVPIE